MTLYTQYGCGHFILCLWKCIRQINILYIKTITFVEKKIISLVIHVFPLTNDLKTFTNTHRLRKQISPSIGIAHTNSNIPVVFFNLTFCHHELMMTNLLIDW